MHTTAVFLVKEQLCRIELEAIIIWNYLVGFHDIW